MESIKGFGKDFILMNIGQIISLFDPIIGGLLYALIYMTWILVISGLCFFTIPFVKKVNTQGILKMAIGDIKVAIHFLSDEQPILFKMLFIIAALNLFL